MPRLMLGLTLLLCACGGPEPEPNTCVPQCSGSPPRLCGSDGCGHSCGTCYAGETCGADFRCSRPACVPRCSGVQCGGINGCGGTCVSGSGCTYVGCYQYPCGCSSSSCSPGCDYATQLREYGNCLSRCTQIEAGCCMTYKSRYPADSCKEGT